MLASSKRGFIQARLKQCFMFDAGTWGAVLSTGPTIHRVVAETDWVHLQDSLPGTLC